MAYTALYRKWRPAIFDDVKGQDPIVTALRNQIRTGRMGHAYLFCGTRGTGKTSVAKIFARAVNCENPQDGNPCNECSACRAALDGSSVNVLEIDAASNNGVDNIREIREEVRYAPTEGKKKVYIIDEVHMLSIGAFNALLKTLEEPPEHVMFILATTESYKIPITVLSRCQRYDFRRIGVDVLAGRLKELTSGEGVEIEDRALRYVARKADGSFRDSISLLDQCIAFHFDEALTYEMVLDVLGATSNELFGALLNTVIEGRTADCLGLIDEIVMQGRELNQLVSDFIWYLRNVMLLKASDLDADTLEVSEEDLLDLAAMSNRVSEPVLMRYIRVFSELSGQIRYVSDKRVQLEMAFIKLIHPETEYNLDSVLNRLEVLENKLKNGYIANQGDHNPANDYYDDMANDYYSGDPYYEDYQNGMPPMDYNDYGPMEMGAQTNGRRGPVRPNGGNAAFVGRNAEGNAEQVIQIAKGQMDQYEAISKKWNDIRKAMNCTTLSLATDLVRAHIEPGREEGYLTIVFFNNSAATLGNRPDYIPKAEAAIKAVTGIDCRVEFKVDVGAAKKTFKTADEAAIKNAFHNIDIETIE